MDSTANWSGYRQGTAPGDWSLVQRRSVDQVNAIVSFTNSVGAAWATPAYDSAGNMTTFPKASDPTTAQSAVYDAWNRLVEVSEGSHIVVQYQYDGVNRQTIQWSYTSGSLSETREYFYTTPSKWQVVEERVNGASTPERQFVWGLRYVDDLVLRERDTDDAGVLDESLYALQDDNWNVTAIIDATGDVQERYAYSPFGAPVFLSGTFGSRAESSFDWKYLFTGRRFDAEIGLYDFRQRPFASLLGVFISRDPLGFADGPNSYAGWFVPHSVDPFGMMSLEKFFNLSQKARDARLRGFWNQYGAFIVASAKKHCVPQELLVTMLLNEIIDYTWTESFFEWQGIGESVGPAQITTQTALDYNLFPEMTLEYAKEIAGGTYDPFTGANVGSTVVVAQLQRNLVRTALSNPSTGIDAAAKLLGIYLDKLCDTCNVNGPVSSDTQIGGMPKEFAQKIVGLPQNADSVAKFKNAVCARRKQSCDSVASMDVNDSLIRAMAAIWNNGIGVLKNVRPNALNHAINAGGLDGIFGPNNEFR
jgi:RHS repeat-associated protein